MSEHKGFDPKLRECAEELKTILKKYDVAATVSLVSSTHGEFFIHFPTWSGAQFEGSNVRIKCKAHETKKAEDTAHIIVSSIQINELFVTNFKVMFDELRKKCLILFSDIHGRINRDGLNDE